MKRHMNHGKRRAAFTLAETMVNIALLTVIMGGLSSAIMITSHAVPASGSVAQSSVDAYFAVEQIAEDMYTARVFTTRNNQRMAFRVPDRNEDGEVEVIRYGWTGTPGDPLKRSYNGVVSEMIDNVTHFEVDFFVITQDTEQDGDNVVSAEGELTSGHTGKGESVPGIGGDVALTQLIYPDLPDDAVSWSITRVKMRLQVKDKDASPPVVSLQTNEGLQPTGDQIDSFAFGEDDLSAAFKWLDITFTGADALRPGQAVWLVIGGKDDSFQCNVRYESGVGTTRSHMGMSTDAEKSWTMWTSDQLQHYVYGTVTTKGETEVVTTEFITSATITLQVGDEANARVVTTVPLLNVPEVVEK